MAEEEEVMPRPILKAFRCCLHCPLPTNARGLCLRCYGRAFRSIRKGEVSGWPELESQGKALPPQSQPERSQGLVGRTRGGCQELTNAELAERIAAARRERESQ